MDEERNLARKLKERLLERNLLDEEKFNRCLRRAERGGESLIEALYREGGVDEKALVALLSEIFPYPPINVSIFTIGPDILKLVPPHLVERHHVLPVTQHEKTLTVAVSDPTQLTVLDDLRALSGLRIKPAIALPSQLEAAIKKYYGAGFKGHESLAGESMDKILEDIRTEAQSPSMIRGPETSDLLQEVNAAPTIQMVNRILLEAIHRRASDIFIEPWEKTMRVRFRIDGVLEEILKTSRARVDALTSRIKVMSRLNIAEHRIPQDGRIRVRISGREIDLRVSILPTSYGEKSCLRILDTSAQTQSLEGLGFEADRLEVIHRESEKPHGMILVTGPTGSGKTTTLYAVLKHLDSPEKNITTVEDPVEYQVPGINQVNVREHVGLTFPVALRSILRQDPDIILIGEIRDLVTMDIAIKSALTGHLVLSTLHTNDATSAIVRMVNMGIEPFLIASSVLMISAQRLVRRLCSLCREPYVRDKITFYRPQGCPQCRQTGYQGRTVITELFELKPDITDLIVKGVSGDELRRAVRLGGMRTLREDGFEKATRGLTSLEEVLRVTSPEPSLEVEAAKR